MYIVAEQLDQCQIQTTIRRRLQLLSVPTDAPVLEPTHTAPSPDGRWLAAVVTDPATDLQRWRVYPRETPDAPAELIESVYPTGIAWTPDSSGFY